MISVYIRGNELYISAGSLKRNSLKITAEKHASAEDVAETAITLIGEITRKKDKVNFVIDEATVAAMDKTMHCVPERKLKKIIDKNSVRKGKTVENQLDAVINGIEANENPLVESTAHITAISAEAAHKVDTIVKALHLDLNDLIIGSTAEARLIGVLDVPFKTFVTISYKDTFATVSLYSKEKQVFSYNAMFTSDDPSFITDRLIKLAHAALTDGREQGYIAEAVFVTGYIPDKFNVFDKTADEIGVNCYEFTAPKKSRGIATEELNRYFAAYGGLVE